jgi:AraC family transcriptional regulator, arabinose operon regulatory protein
MSYLQDLHLTESPSQVNAAQVTEGVFWDIYHAHQGLEFIYVHQGTGSVVVEQQIYSFGPGTLMMFQPYQLHRVHLDTAKTPYIRSRLLFEPSALEAVLTPYPVLHSFFLHLWKEQTDNQIVSLPALEPALNSLLSAYEFNLVSDQPMEPGESFSLLLVSFLNLLRREWPDRVRSRSLSRSFHHAEKVLQWIDGHYQEEFRLDSLSRELHLTPSHVSHLFRQYTGTSITDYLSTVRIREACRLLRATSASLDEISSLVGLKNASYFCKLFRERTGLTPHQYRKGGS